MEVKYGLYEIAEEKPEYQRWEMTKTTGWFEFIRDYDTEEEAIDNIKNLTGKYTIVKIYINK